MNVSLVAIIGFVLLFSSATSVYAELGKNFDRVQLDADTFLWTSHYERIWDGQKWVNYILTESNNSIRFESASMNFKLNKSTCEFSLFNPITKETSIDSFSQTLTKNGLDTILSPCDVVLLTPNNDNLILKITRTTDGGSLDITYQIDAMGSTEWTYEISNTELFAVTTFGIIETCTNCEPNKTEGDLLFFDDYYLDTKNEEHNTLKSTEQDKTDLKLTYEAEPINYFDKVIIDPTFGYTTGTDYVITTTSTTGTACGTGNTKSNALPIQLHRPTNSANDACKGIISRWDISSIPTGQVDVSNTLLRFDIEAVSASTDACDYWDISNDPSTASAANLWNDLIGGTQFVNGNGLCQTAADDKVLDLGTTADADIESKISNQWWAVGIAVDTFVRGGADILLTFDQTTENKQIELQITYDQLKAYPEVINVDVVGDKAKIYGNMYVLSNPLANITSQKLFVNGTLSQHNQTIHQGTTNEYRVNFGPYWYRMATNNVYNFTMQVTAQRAGPAIVTNQSTVFDIREYAPQYFTAEVPAQGKYNYTFNGGLFKVNRNVTGVLNETFQIECFFQNWALVAFNSTSGTWLNHTNVGYDLEQAPDINPNFNYLISCYNEDLLFSDTVYTDGPLALLGIGSLDATYASYLGVPVGVLFIVMAASLASQRNAPIWIVIILAIAGVMATIGFFTIEPLVWALALIAGLLGLFVGRKLF